MTPISLNDTGQGGCRALRLNPDRVASGLGSRVAITDGVTVIERPDGMAMPVLDPGQPGRFCQISGQLAESAPSG
jgi:hypothetical protein